MLIHTEFLLSRLKINMKNPAMVLLDHSGIVIKERWVSYLKQFSFIILTSSSFETPPVCTL